MQSRRWWWVSIFLTSIAMTAVAAEKKEKKAASEAKPAAAAPAGDQAASASKENTATTPAPRDPKGWHDRHDAMNERVKKGKVDLVFIGDSITQGWEGAGKEVWKKYYGERSAVNLGIGGDRTQHVLWRLQNGNIDGIHPKAAVIMIGTNNSNREDNTVAEIAAGVTAIVKHLREKLPEMKILLVGIFPRGEQPNAQRGKLLQVNQILNKLNDSQHVFYVDIGYHFVDADGSIPKALMPDFLHLSPEGYEIWAKAIEPKLAKAMGEK